MRVTSHTHLAIATIILALAFTCYGASGSEPNAAEANLTSAKEVAAERDTATQIKKNDELSDSTRAQIERLAKEYYKDTADRQGRAFYAVIAIVAVFVIYVVFKDRGEYNKAVAEAREASKEARIASDKARDWEERAREKLANIDKKVETKLKEIEGRGKQLITDLIQTGEKQRKASREEAEKQRKISELFTKGINAHQSKDYALTVDYFEQIVKIDPTNAPALSNGSAALGELAKTKEGNEASNLLIQACEKCEKAIKIKPNFAQAYSNWAVALIALAETKEDDEAYSFLGQACEKCEKAIKIKPNYAEAYSVWGISLSELARIKANDKLFKQAYEKYKKAVELKPSYFEAWNNWGAALIYQSRNKTNQERKNLLNEAKEKCLKAESIKTGSASYNLGCAHALLDEKKDCQKWLQTGEKAGTLETREKAMAEPDLKSVRDKAWFKKIRWSAAPK